MVRSVRLCHPNKLLAQFFSEHSIMGALRRVLSVDQVLTRYLPLPGVA